MTNTADPIWVSDLRRLAKEKPKAAAATLAIDLDLAGHPGITGAQVKPWLDRIRAGQQEGVDPTQKEIPLHLLDRQDGDGIAAA